MATFISTMYFTEKRIKTVPSTCDRDEPMGAIGERSDERG